MIISAGILGGLFLVIGAYTLSQGKALVSLLFYFIADLCWVKLAINSGDVFGAVSIVIGITFSLITMLKMQTGKFHKTLNKEHSE